MKKLVPVYPWPMHPKVAEVLEAIPDVQLVEALPGGPGPVLAIRKVPPFACDAIIVLSPEKAAQAVDLVTGNGLSLSTRSDFLASVFEGVVTPIETVPRGPRSQWRSL